MKKVFPERKDSIVLTAIEIISDLGIQGLSTKELAKRQEITESLLYRHFRSKDEIIVAVLEYYSRFDKVIMDTITRKNSGAKEKIIEFTRLYVEYYENYRAISAILHSYQQFLNDTNTSGLVRDIFFKRNSFLAELVGAGQSREEISLYYSPEELADILTGYTTSLILKWRMSGFSFPLKERVLATLEKILSQC